MAEAMSLDPSDSPTSFHIRKYITVNFPDQIEKEKAQLDVVPGLCIFTVGSEKIRVREEDLRYVSKTMCFQQDWQTFIVSFCDQNVIKHIFFELEESRGEQAQETCFNSLHQLVQVKYSSPKLQISESATKRVVELLEQQPSALNVVQVKVDKIVKEDKGGEESGLRADDAEDCTQLERSGAPSWSSYVLVMDLEGICLYGKDLQQPEYRLMFWLEVSTDTVDEVKLVNEQDGETFLRISTHSSTFSLVSTTISLKHACVTQC